MFSGFAGVLPVLPAGREVAVYEDEKEKHQQEGGRSGQESILTAPPDDGSRKDKEEALHQIVAAADSDVHKEKGNAQNEPCVGNYRTYRIAPSQFSGSLHSSHNGNGYFRQRGGDADNGSADNESRDSCSSGNPAGGIYKPVSSFSNQKYTGNEQNSSG